jgi:dephospho-CoA kinase
MDRKRRDSRKRRDVVAVGLTGGIGAGKSTALALFEQEGALTFSADRIVHDLYSKFSVVARIGAHFGRGVLDDDGVAVDRSRLAAALRGRPDDLRWLEELTHPLVAKEIERRIRSAPAWSVVVCEVPLLFESGLEELFDLVITVEADEDVRRMRSIHGFDLGQFAEFQNRQLHSRDRAQAADVVFYNNGTTDDMAEFVHGAFKAARRLLPEVLDGGAS